MSRTARITTIGATTTAVVVLPLWLVFSVLSEHLVLERLPTWSAILIGVSLLMLVLAGPAVVWATVVARSVGVEWAPVASTTLRTALPLAALVGLTVDFSQVFIDIVAPWHSHAVHALFAVSFATGLSLFFGTLARRLVRRLRSTSGSLRPASRHRVALAVVLATSTGVALGALVALPLGWQVRPWMGIRMLKPMYLVLATGSAGGGAAIGAALLRLRLGYSADRRPSTLQRPAPRTTT